MTNALKFSKKDIIPEVHISATISENMCHLKFSDNGIGFESQYNEKVFEVFQRLHNHSVYEGTGIGLSIVKKIVENHGGKITASGELENGVRFDIDMPVKS